MSILACFVKHGSKGTHTENVSFQWENSVSLPWNPSPPIRTSLLVRLISESGVQSTAYDAIRHPRIVEIFFHDTAPGTRRGEDTITIGLLVRQGWASGWRD